MPTYEISERCWREFARLSPERRAAFRRALRSIIQDLQANRSFRPSLRVRAVEGHPGVFEMSWAADGRATFEYGEARPGTGAHVLWRRLGTHAIFREP